MLSNTTPKFDFMLLLFNFDHSTKQVCCGFRGPCALEISNRQRARTLARTLYTRTHCIPYTLRLPHRGIRFDTIPACDKTHDDSKDRAYAWRRAGKKLGYTAHSLTSAKLKRFAVSLTSKALDLGTAGHGFNISILWAKSHPKWFYNHKNLFSFWGLRPDPRFGVFVP